MKTKCQCQWCEEPIYASESLIAKARAGDVVLTCHWCKSEIEQNTREAEEYKRLYAEQLRQLHAQHTGQVPL